MFFLHFDHPINSDLNDLTYQKWWLWMLCTVYIERRLVLLSNQVKLWGSPAMWCLDPGVFCGGNKSWKPEKYGETRLSWWENDDWWLNIGVPPSKLRNIICWTSWKNYPIFFGTSKTLILNGKLPMACRRQRARWNVPVISGCWDDNTGQGSLWLGSWVSLRWLVVIDWWWFMVIIMVIHGDS